jgi:hypothetical protein
VRWIFCLALILYATSGLCQIVLSPVNSTRVEVGDVIEIRVVSGSEYSSKIDLKVLIEKMETEKFYLMDTYERSGEKIAKIVLASKFSDNESVPVAGIEGISNVELKGFSFMATKAEKKELVYNDIPLLEDYDYKKWVILSVGVVLLGVLAFVIKNKLGHLKKKNEKTKKMKEWVRRLESATNLSSCSEIWLQREVARIDLEGFEKELDDFFATLSPAQFKLVPPDELDEDVRRAKEALILKVKEKRFGA